MNVVQLIQRTPRAAAADMNVTSLAEGEEVVAWAKNNQLTFQGELEDEPGIFIFYLGTPPWHTEVRSDAGCHMVRWEPTLNPDLAAELYWPPGMADWEVYVEGTSGQAAPWAV